MKINCDCGKLMNAEAVKGLSSAAFSYGICESIEIKARCHACKRSVTISF